MYIMYPCRKKWFFPLLCKFTLPSDLKPHRQAAAGDVDFAAKARLVFYYPTHVAMRLFAQFTWLSMLFIGFLRICDDIDIDPLYVLILWYISVVYSRSKKRKCDKPPKRECILGHIPACKYHWTTSSLDHSFLGTLQARVFNTLRRTDLFLKIRRSTNWLPFWVNIPWSSPFFPRKKNTNNY